jgi:hypothetical protein
MIKAIIIQISDILFKQIDAGEVFQIKKSSLHINKFNSTDLTTFWLQANHRVQNPRHRWDF